MGAGGGGRISTTSGLYYFSIDPEREGSEMNGNPDSGDRILEIYSISILPKEL